MKKKAGRKGEIPMTLVAMMEDRYLMNKQEAQIYGTQVYGGEVTDPETGERRMVYLVWPIEDPETVNERRKAIGYATPVEAYAAGMDVEYAVFTLEQVKEMFDH